MAKELGTGHFLRKRTGGGKEMTSWSGSLHLMDAAFANLELDKNALKRQGNIDSMQAMCVKRNYRRKLSALKFLDKVQTATLNVKYLDGVLRGKPWWQSHSLSSRTSNREETASYVPSLIENNQSGFDSDPEVFLTEITPNLTKRRRSSSLTSLEKLAKTRGMLKNKTVTTDEQDLTKTELEVADSDLGSQVNKVISGHEEDLEIPNEPFRQRAETGEGLSKPRIRRDRRLSRSYEDLRQFAALKPSVIVSKNHAAKTNNISEKNLPLWLRTPNSTDKTNVERRLHTNYTSPAYPAWLSSDSSSSADSTPKIRRKKYKDGKQ